MANSVKSHNVVKLFNSATKTKLEKQARPLLSGSAYDIYLNSLAVSGRNSVATLLNQSITILGYEGAPERYHWHQLTFEKVHLIRATLIEAGYSVNTINLSLSALKGVAKTAFNLGKMSADDMMRINSVKSLKGNAVRNGRRIIHAEINKLLGDNSSDTAKSARDKALLSIGVGAGLRRSEICALDIGDVDFKHGLLTVKQGKGRKHRQIYLAKDLLIALKAWLKYRGLSEGALFTRIRKNGQLTLKRLSANGLAYVLDSLQTQCNVDSFSPHDMRRTFITQLLEKDVDLNTVRQLAGHSDISTTIKYDKRDIESQKRASQGIRF